MAKQFKVWIEIEAYDEDPEDGEEESQNMTPIDMGCSASFDTLEEAEAFARVLHHLGEGI